MNEQEYRTPDDIMKEIAKTYTELGILLNIHFAKSKTQGGQK